MSGMCLYSISVIRSRFLNISNVVNNIDKTGIWNYHIFQEKQGRLFRIGAGVLLYV